MNTNSSGKGIILVVEDNELTQGAYKLLLQSIAKKLLIVKDAETTLNVVNDSGNVFDLILLNIGLPDMNGFSLGEKLRKQGIKIPIIAISANYFQIEVQITYRYIFNEFLVKPLMPSHIEKLLNKYLRL
jgi:two-component system, sensor histidine kinase